MSYCNVEERKERHTVCRARQRGSIRRSARSADRARSVGPHRGAASGASSRSKCTHHLDLIRREVVEELIAPVHRRVRVEVLDDEGIPLGGRHGDALDFPSPGMQAPAPSSEKDSCHGGFPRRRVTTRVRTPTSAVSHARALARSPSSARQRNLSEFARRTSSSLFCVGSQRENGNNKTHL